MRKTLIACATIGVLASAAAWGDTGLRAEPRASSPEMIRVQYAQPSPQYVQPAPERWDDRALGINEREARIKDRIHRGLSDGRITDREGRWLLRQLASVESKERAYLSDGRLSGRETADLNRDLDRLALNVRTQLRDDERRY
jgi:hypothetical protein